MPLYEYECEACGTRFEELVAVGATPACPACGANDARRVWSPVASAGTGVGLTGKAAAESNARRGEREARRQAGFAEARKQRREGR